MDIERILLDDQMAPVSHYCHSVRAGSLIWVSGIVGQTADGHDSGDDIELQANTKRGVDPDPGSDEGVAH